MKKISSFWAYLIIGLAAALCAYSFFALVNANEKSFNTGTSLTHIINNSPPAIRVSADQKGELMLTDMNGMTLYVYNKDAENASKCSGSCLKTWPAATTATTTMRGHTQLRGPIGSYLTPAGKRQITYKGQPLYKYYKDKQPGDTFGDGVNDTWSIARP